MDCCEVSSEIADMASAVERISFDAAATFPTMSFTEDSKLSARLCISRRFSSAARRSRSSCSASRRCARSMFFLNTAAALAICPTSSARSAPTISTDVSSSARRRSVFTMFAMGRVMPKRAMTTARIKPTAKPIAVNAIRAAARVSYTACDSSASRLMAASVRRLRLRTSSRSRKASSRLSSMAVRRVISQPGKALSGGLPQFRYRFAGFVQILR